MPALHSEVKSHVVHKLIKEVLAWTPCSSPASVQCGGQLCDAGCSCPLHSCAENCECITCSEPSSVPAPCTLHTQVRNSPTIFFSRELIFLYWDHLLRLNMKRFGAHKRNFYCVSAGIISLQTHYCHLLYPLPLSF